MSQLFGMATTAGIGLATNLYNNYYAQQRAEQDRLQNFIYGERAAQNADMRTRALYNDFYSPQAMLNQYKKAGLSPSIMYGGMPGQGGMSGAQGTGSGAMQTPYMPISLLEGAEIANLQAQTQKTKAETKQVQVDTERQNIAKQIEELQAGQYQNEWNIINSTWIEDGKQKSIFEAARDHYTYESFMEWCRDGKTAESIKNATSTEAGQRILRNIYLAANHFHRDIMVLSAESVSASFQQSVISAMDNEEFAKLNSQAAIKYLKQNIETAELNTTQKEAWNNLINSLGKKGSTTRDIIVVLGMILNNAMSNWHMPNVNFNSTTNNNSYTKLQM